MGKRKIELIKGKIKNYWINGEKNPCGCGSHVYHCETDGHILYGVCNACYTDIYYIEGNINFTEWRWR